MNEKGIKSDVAKPDLPPEKVLGHKVRVLVVVGILALLDLDQVSLLHLDVVTGQMSAPAQDPQTLGEVDGFGL